MRIKDVLANKESLQEVLNQLSEALKDFLVADAPSIKWEMPVTDTVATQIKYKDISLREWCKKMFEEKAMTLKHLAWILGIAPEEVNDAINPAYTKPEAKFHPGYNVYNQAHTEKLLREKDEEITKLKEKCDAQTNLITTLYARINNLENANTGSPWFFPNFTWCGSSDNSFTKEQISEAAKKFSNAPPPEIVAWCVVKSETK